MPDILFVKPSSLGDVIHHMPAVMDVRRHIPDARIDWVVEEDLAALVRLHPEVGGIIPVATRRWRRALTRAQTWREAAAFRAAVRARRYDAIVDSQGLIRSAVMARLARGPRHGYDSRSIREPLASILYDVRHAVTWRAHAVTRNRALAGLALGYEPDPAMTYGLDRARFRDPSAPSRAILFHSTARSEKEWPEEHWVAMASALAARGHEMLLPWGSQADRARAERIAARVEGARVLDRQPYDRLAGLIANAPVVVGLDTGLMHLAAALGVPTLAVFVATPPEGTRPVGNGPLAVIGGDGIAPRAEEAIRALDGLA